MRFFLSPSLRRGRTASLIGGETFSSLTADQTPDYLVRGIIVHSAGVVSFITANNDTLTFADGELATGIVHPFEIKTLLRATTAKVTLGK